LIDGDGHFSTQQQLVICFSLPDVHLAYYIKKLIGFGHVKKCKNKNAYIYIVSNRDGMLKVLTLVNGKLRTTTKLNQVIGNILKNYRYSEYNIKFIMNVSNDFNNY